MLTFDPTQRIAVTQALEHTWLASYHDEADEPDCPHKFEKWRDLEKLETLDDYREALWNEIEDFRREARGVNDLSGQPIHRVSVSGGSRESGRRAGSHASVHDYVQGHTAEPDVIVESPEAERPPSAVPTEIDEPSTDTEKKTPQREGSLIPAQTMPFPRPRSITSVSATDPVVTYARRSSILQPSRQGSTFNSPQPAHPKLPPFTESPTQTELAHLPPGSIAFPTQQGYVLPARSRTGSTVGGEAVTRRLLRTLSTVSIHESAEGLAGGLAQIAPIGKFIVERQTTGADAPPSEMPKDFGLDETSDDEYDDGHRKEKNNAS